MFSTKDLMCMNFSKLITASLINQTIWTDNTHSLYLISSFTYMLYNFRIMGRVDKQFDTKLFRSAHTATSILIRRGVLKTVERSSKGIQSIVKNELAERLAKELESKITTKFTKQ